MTTNQPTTFWERLNTLLDEADWSQQTLSYEYRDTWDVDLSVHTVASWGKRDTPPSADTVARLALMFGVSPLWLLGFTDRRDASDAPAAAIHRRKGRASG